MAEVIMPKAGDAMDEGVIVQWLKKVGDSVGAEDTIAEIETDKSNVAVEAGVAGIIQKIMGKPGDSIPVGQVIAIIGDTAVAADAADATHEALTAAEGSGNTPTPEAKPEAEPAIDPAKSNGVAPKATTAAPAAPQSTPTTVALPPKVATPSEAFKPYASFVGAMPEMLGGSASVIGEPIELEGDDASSSERVKATPVARAMAQANKLNLSALQATGPVGAVSKKDVEAALTSAPATSAAPAQAATASAPATDEVEVQEYNAMRRTIAKRLAESKSTIPHFYITAELDMEAFMALREQVNAAAGETQPKISLNDLLIKAVAVALTENPVINSSFADNKRYMKKSVNIGVAVSVDDGLIVPVVRNCDTKSARQIAKETRPLIDKARTGKLAPADYTGGTFTISNMGSLTPDVDNFAAIVNPGEGGILACASIRTVPAVVGGQVVPRKRMKVTLSADHRVADGAAGALFVQSLKRVVENPLQILA